MIHDLEAIPAMSQAYESVLKQLRDRGQPRIVQEISAKRLSSLLRLVSGSRTGFVESF
jgi:hypothetical protein